MIPLLSSRPADAPALRLAEEMQYLYRWTDRMLQARYEAKMAAIEHQENLTRTELQTAQAESMAQAHQELSDRLRTEAAGPQTLLSPWLVIERIYIDVQNNGDAVALADECWEYFGSTPAAADNATLAANPLDEDALTAELLDAMLRYRYLQTLSYLAVRNDSTADRLLDYTDRAIADHAENDGWKQQKFKLLVALDRPESIRDNLTKWIEASGADQRWRLDLGRVQAELGDVEAAIKQFETVRKLDELTPDDYQALSDWYLIVDRLEDRRRMQFDQFMKAAEYDIVQYLSASLRPLQSRSVPDTQLDEQIFMAFEALSRKSSSPSNYSNLLNNYYGYTRDFRLLAALPDAVIGHTALQIYPYLGGSRGILNNVMEEATIDSLVEALAEVRQRAKTDVDRRAA